MADTSDEKALTMILMITACIASLLGLLTLFFTFNYIKEYIRYRRLITMLPGPKQIPLFGNVLDFMCDDATAFRKLRKWGQDYYPVYNLSAMMYASANITGPEDFEAIASTTKNIKKAFIYSFLEMWLGEGLLTSTGTKWHNRRKILTPAFHFSILQKFVTIFNNETENLVKVLKAECHKPYVNVVPFISQFTLCTINETSMGTKLDLKKEEDKIYYSALHRIGKFFYYRMIRPWLYLDSIYYYLSPEGFREKNLIKILHTFTNNIINKRSENFEKFDVTSSDEYNFSTRKKLAMLDLLLNSKNGNDQIIDDKGIQDEVNTFMFEGHDTTSMSICLTLMLLASHRETQEAILQEMIQVCGDINSQPTFQEFQEMKYLERCIKESLRLYPSVPFIGRILEEDVTTSIGYILPKSTAAHIHIFDIHRNPKIWPDPEKFDPDRFLPENCLNRHPFAYVPFSAGPRNCIGQRYAILELKAVLCGVIKNFVLEPVDTPDNIVLVPDIVLRSETGMIKVKFIPRQP